MDDEDCAKSICFDNISIYRFAVNLLNRNEIWIDSFVKRAKMKMLLNFDEKKV